MQSASDPVSPRKWRRGLLTLGVLLALAVLTGGAARAQNLDEGKSAARLFADGCATCHRSPHGLTKGRFRPSLFLFLQQHYATSSSSAWALASYLESVDSTGGGRSHATAKRSPAATGTSRPSLRPPLPVSGR
jgi:hypothetical protein